MTDVDETVPTASLVITPQTPTVTAGTGSVNSIPTAALTLSPLVPGFQQHPLFEVLDSNGNRIDTVTFENVEAGMETDNQVIVLVNNTSSSEDITLTATLGDDGTSTETTSSTLLSEDDVDYVITTDTYTIPANSSLPVYIKWRPPSTTRPGLKTWTLDLGNREDISPLSGWIYVGVITIDGSVDGTLTDYQVEVSLDYSEDVMRTDFGDVRFTLTDSTPLYYHLSEYITSESATFIVKIPSIPAHPDTMNIYIHTGNPDATNDSDIDNTYIFYDDATGTYSDKWTDIQGTGGYTTISGKQAISLDSATTNIRTSTVQATAPFQIEAELYSTSIVTGIQYCQDTTPSSNEKYHARIDVRTMLGGDGILKDGNYIVNGGVYETPSTWYPCILTLDENGNHTWTVEGRTPLSVNDLTYTSGYLALNHNNSGTGAVANLKVTKYTPNPPIVDNIILWNDLGEITLTGGVVYSIPDLPELELSNHYFVNVGGTDYE